MHQELPRENNSTWKNLSRVNLPYGMNFYSELTDTKESPDRPTREARQRDPPCSVVLTNHYMESDMNTIATKVKAFIADENGVTAIEYGLIAALIGVAMAVAAKALGLQIGTTFDGVVTAMKNSASS